MEIDSDVQIGRKREDLAERMLGLRARVAKLVDMSSATPLGRRIARQRSGPEPGLFLATPELTARSSHAQRLLSIVHFSFSILQFLFYISLFFT
jgi:hypothetical protein